MRCFVANFVENQPKAPRVPIAERPDRPGAADIVCDEEVLAGLRT